MASEQELVALPAAGPLATAAPVASGAEQKEVKERVAVPVLSSSASVRSGIVELDFDSPEAIATSGAVFCDAGTGASASTSGLRVSVVGEYEFVRMPRGGHLVLSPDAYVRIDGILNALQQTGAGASTAPLKDYSIVIDCGVRLLFVISWLLSFL